MEILKKIPQKQVKFILVLLTLIIVVCSYFFGQQKYSKKAELLKKENISLTNEMNELQQKNRNKDVLIKEINEMNDRAKLLIDEFPSELTQDKNIMFIHNLSNHTGMDIKGINLSDNELFYPIVGQSTPDMEDLLGYKAKITISYSSTYEALKRCIKYIHDYDERMNIPGFSASFDHATGNLSGTMTIHVYALCGMDKEFNDAIIDGVTKGKDNIFGTFENP